MSPWICLGDKKSWRELFVRRRTWRLHQQHKNEMRSEKKCPWGMEFVRDCLDQETMRIECGSLPCGRFSPWPSPAGKPNSSSLLPSRSWGLPRWDLSLTHSQTAFWPLCLDGNRNYVWPITPSSSHSLLPSPFHSFMFFLSIFSYIYFEHMPSLSSALST